METHTHTFSQHICHHCNHDHVGDYTQGLLLFLLFITITIVFRSRRNAE